MASYEDWEDFDDETDDDAPTLSFSSTAALDAPTKKVEVPFKVGSDLSLKDEDRCGSLRAIEETWRAYGTRSF